MGNTLLTPAAITREALRILHNKAMFIGSINKQYDSSFAKSGAKIGSDLKIRLPNQYTVRSGAVLNVQDTTEASTTLTVNKQRGVDFKFGSDELTMSLDDFSSRILEPAMAVLAANIENEVYTDAYRNVYNMVDSDGQALDFYDIMDARRLLNNNLVPMDDNRNVMLTTLHSAKLVDTLKGLFHDSEAIKKQYKEGKMGRTGGFDFWENPIIGKHTTGTAVSGDTLYNVNGANQSGATLTVNTGTTTFLIGDVITIAGCNAVHPETKADLGYAQQFVITANSGANATSLAISPAIVTSGARQNVSGAPTDTGAVTKVGGGASATLDTSLAYHKDFCTFATADLVMPSGVDFSAREVMDGISIRVIRQYDINNDAFPCRLDVLFGHKVLRPEMAARIHADG
jgi:hypothetical protein